MTRRRLLVVDDEQMVVDGLRRTLRHEGYEIITTTSPLRALAHLRDDDIDILISDIDMPEMTGLELVAEARRSHPQVVRILLTGDGSMESAMQAINEGQVHKYLTKPWSSGQLRETLREMVALLDAMRERAAAAQAAENDSARAQEIEAANPGIRSVVRVNGAYLLNDMRVVEGLTSLGNAGEPFAASRWLQLAADATVDIKEPR